MLKRLRLREKRLNDEKEKQREKKKMQPIYNYD